jgi:hypothetical protein
MAVLRQVVVEARGVGSRSRYPLDPLDEVIEVLRPLEAVWQNADARSSNFFGVSGLKKLGKISCQFLPTGGTIIPGYVLQLLFREKFQKLLIPRQPLKLQKK